MKQNWIRFVALFLALTMVLVSGIITTTSSFHASEENNSEAGVGEEVELAEAPESVDIDEELQKAAEESVSIDEAVNKEDSEAEEKNETSDKSVITFAAGNGGTVSIEKQELLPDEEPVPVEAVAEEGYRFVSWTKAGEEVSSEAVFTPENVTADFVAVFEEENKLPAQEFTSVVSGTRISVNAPEGAFSEGTTMNVEEVISDKVVESVDEASDYKVDSESVKAFDITFTDKEGKEIEPLIPVELSFSNVEIESDTLEVFHLDDADSPAESVSELTANTGEIRVASAAEFSIYVVVGGSTKSTVSCTAKTCVEDPNGSIKALGNGKSFSLGADMDVTFGTNAEGEDYNEASVSTSNAAYSGDRAYYFEGEDSNKKGYKRIYKFYIKKEGSKYCVYADFAKDEKIKLTDGDNVTDEWNNVFWMPEFEEHLVFHYALIPGMDANVGLLPGLTIDDIWFGIGVTSVKGLKDASEYLKPRQTGDLPGNLYSEAQTVSEVKKLYPDLTIDGKVYKYAEKGSANADKKGYYTLDILRFRKSKGAARGNNAYNEPQIMNMRYTFHLDHVIVANQEDKYIYNFMVKEPGESDFLSVPGYSKTVTAGFEESKIKKPNMKDKDYDNQKWKFDGWYRDAACTIKADFKGVINANTTYYGKYVAVEPEKVPYVVKHWQQKVDGGSEENSANFVEVESESFTGPVGKKVSPAVKTYKGFKSPKVKEVVITGPNMVINYYYTRKEYKITYDLRGGELVKGSDNYTDNGDGTVYYKARYGANTPVPTNRPTKKTTGANQKVYVFTGWEPNIESTVKGNMTYYAKYAQGELIAEGEVGVYNGKEYTVKVTKNENITGIQYSVDKTNWTNTPPKYTEAGSYPVTVRGKIKGTSTYITCDTRIIISKKDVTVTAHSFSREYNGNEISVDEISAANSGKAYTNTEIVEGQKLSAAISVTPGVDGVNLSSGSSIVGDVTIKKGNNDVTHNYNVIKANGTITISGNGKALTITITGDSANKTYNGKEQKIGTFSYVIKDKNNKVLSGYSVENLSASAKGTNAGAYETVFAGTDNLVIKDSKGRDVTKHFSVVYVNGRLTINPAKLLVKGVDKSKPYDGTALVGAMEATGLVSGHSISNVTFTTKPGWKFWLKEEGIKYPTLTERGTLDYTPEKDSITIVSGNDVVTGNYTIKTGKGTLEITKPGSGFDLTVTANGGSYTYDGTEKFAEVIGGKQYKVSGLSPTDEVQGVEVEGSATNVGDPGKTSIKKGLLGPNVKVVNIETGVDVTDCYNINTVDGKIKINKRSLTLRANSGEKVYDGVALTPSVGGDGKLFTVEEEGDKLAAGHSVEATVEGSRTKAGTSDSTVSKAVIKANGTGDNLSKNYDITYKSGKLVVHKKDISLESKSAEKMYDAEPLTSNAVKLGGMEFTAANGENIVVTTPEGDTIIVSVSGSQTLVGSSDNTFNIVSGDDNYNVNKVNGTLRVKDTEDNPDDPDNPKTPEGVLIKRADNANRVYRLGETVEFTITVKNIYDSEATAVLTEKEGIVFDSLPAGAQVEGNRVTFVLAKEESVEIKASHVITQEDLDGNDPITGAGKYENDARVTFIPTDPGIGTDNPEFKDHDEVPTFVPHPNLTVRKTSDVEPGREVKLGDTITYTITVTNNGNEDLKDVKVEDKLTNDSWTIDTLAIGESKDFTTTYKVTEKDVEKGMVANTATAKGNPGGNPDNPVGGDDTIEVPVDKNFRLTVHYIDESGNKLAGDYTETVAYGKASSVIYSPTLSGMTPSFDYVQISSMPARNVEVDVVYRSTPVEPTNPTTTPTGPAPAPTQPPAAPNLVSPTVAPRGTTPAANLNGGEAVIDNNGNARLVPVEDVDTALANKKLEGELWNILYFLILLVTIVVLYNCFASVKKHQARIYELRDKLKSKDPYRNR